jgi:nucleoside-diphosphate-sugar epimerase
MVKKKILITGSNSGLGKYLVKAYKCYGLDRKTNINLIKKIKWKLIIHCASNKNKINSQNSNNTQIINDNILLSKTISKLRGKKIYISSIEVYREIKNNKSLDEKTKINIDNTNDFYAKCKLISEKFFLQDKYSLVLRLGSIIGPYMKENNATKILKKKKITLSKDSVLSYVHYSEIKKFIDLAYLKKLTGIYNFLRNDYINLSKIIGLLKIKIKFGKHKFAIVKASNKKISKYINLKKYSSADILEQLENKNLKTIKV